MGIVSIEILI
jgi:hypothetical protein